MSDEIYSLPSGLTAIPVGKSLKVIGFPILRTGRARDAWWRIHSRTSGPSSRHEHRSYFTRRGQWRNWYRA